MVNTSFACIPQEGDAGSGLFRRGLYGSSCLISIFLFYLSCKLSRLHLIICPCFSTLNMRVLKNRKFFRKTFRSPFSGEDSGGFHDFPISRQAGEIQFSVLKGLTEEEKYMCINVFDKICNNAEEYLREYKENTNEK